MRAFARVCFFVRRQGLASVGEETSAWVTEIGTAITGDVVTAFVPPHYHLALWTDLRQARVFPLFQIERADLLQSVLEVAGQLKFPLSKQCTLFMRILQGIIPNEDHCQMLVGQSPFARLSISFGADTRAFDDRLRC